VIEAGDPAEIEELDPGSLEEARPLWAALHEHHLSLGSPREIVAQPRTSEQSWRFRRDAVRGWIESEGGFALIARREGAPVGFAVARTQQASGTWEIGDRLGVLDIIVVAPQERGRGTGRALMDEVESRLRAAGVRMLAIEALSTNELAISFYRARGAVESTRTYWLPLE
jgi:ribosomal protein S18 acetylase RimI-like enzyme